MLAYLLLCLGILCFTRICALGQSCYDLGAGWLIPTRPKGKVRYKVFTRDAS